MNTIRRSVRCNDCHDDFSYKIQLTDELLQKTLRVQLSCPFCHAKLELDLNPYQGGDTQLFRTADNLQDSATLPTLNLPNELPSTLRDAP